MPTAFAMRIRLEPFTNNHYAAARALWQATDGVGLSGADSEESLVQFLARNPGTSYVALTTGTNTICWRSRRER